MSETPTDERTDRRTGTTDVIDTGTMKILSGIASLIGLWIVASPFVLESTATATWNNVIAGAAIFLLAGYNVYRMTNDWYANVAVASLVALMGLWALASPFLLEMGSDALLWSTAISGLVVAALAAYNAYANQSADTRAGTGTRA